MTYLIIATKSHHTVIFYHKKSLNMTYTVTTQCKRSLSLHAYYRSLPARGLSTASRADANSLRALWPIRTPERSSRLGGQMRILFTQPHVTPLHVRNHATSFSLPYNYSPGLQIFRTNHEEGCIFRIKSFRHIIVPFWFGGKRHMTAWLL